ncbi:MAG: hypothetical protein ACFFB0_11360 [Promethearchaeota archaeon]
MGKGKVIGIVLAVIIVGALGTFFLIGFLTQGTIESSGTRYYQPTTASDPEPIVIRTDVGNIDINYNTSATPYLAKIDYEVKVKGTYMIEKSFSDFFTIEWHNLTSDDKTVFYLRTKRDLWIDPSTWFSVKQIEIEVTLRSDIKYALEIYATTGNVVTTIPKNSDVDSLYIETTTGNSITSLEELSIGNFQVEATTGNPSIYAKKVNLTSGIIAEATTGNLRLNLSSCLLGGKIDGEVTTGNLYFNSYNTRITGDSTWDLTTTTGSIHCSIIQNVDLGGNIQGNWEVTTGNINIDYIDNLSTVGASFSGTMTTGSFKPSNSGGFEVIGTTAFRSLDYSSANYTYTLDLETTTGNINIDGKSS